MSSRFRSPPPSAPEPARSRPCAWTQVLAAVAASFGSLACPSSPTGGPCGTSVPNVPAFELQITASGPPFHQLKVDVHSSGGEESYDLATMCDPASSLACFRAEPGDLCGSRPDASWPGFPGFGLNALTCALWSDGAVDLSMLADGYPPYALQLSPDRDDCERIATRHADVELGARD